MAPRTAKAKKAAVVTEGPKKGRGKAKTVEDVEPELDEQIDEIAPVVEKKTRGKKGAGDKEVAQNGKEDAPPAKKGRKKKVEEPIDTIEDNQETNDDQRVEDEASIPEPEEAPENGDIKEAEPVKGRKKAAGKKDAAPKSETKSGRVRKAKQEPEDAEEQDEEDQKPKPVAKGRGRKAQPKETEPEESEPEPQDDEELSDGENLKPKPAAKGRGRKAQPKDTEPEEVSASGKPEPASKGRKKAPAKKEKTPESEKEVEDEEQQKEEPSKRETKGKKTQKKAQAKEDSEEEPAEELPAAKKRKVNKKEDKGKGDSKDDTEEEQSEPKTKGKRGQKKAVEVDNDGDHESTAKRRRKPVEDKAPENEKKPAPKNKAVTNYEELDFSNTSKNKDSKDWNFKISSWNVDGIRAWMNKGGLDYLTHEKPDILCIQETKCSKEKLPEELTNVPGYHAYWLCSDQDGYAGVGIYTTQLAMNVQYGLQNDELDSEGRIITAEYEQFYLICTYVPNAGRKLVTMPKRLQWNEEFRKFVKELDKKKPVIICGDMNVSHQEIDLANPKSNRKNAGFTDEERAGMTALLGDGFVDTFRHLYPDHTGAYTFWTYMMNSRAKNVGWRLDYFIVSERLLPAVCDNVIRSEVYGSDHCPISLFLRLNGADKPKE